MSIINNKILAFFFVQNFFAKKKSLFINVFYFFKFIENILVYNLILSQYNLVFLDRGIPDVLAYMNFIGDTYPDTFINVCENHKYDQVFILAPWQEIYISDSERYESFDQAIEIHQHLINTYSKFGYHLIDVPFESVKKRTDFILNSIKSF